MCGFSFDTDTVFPFKAERLGDSYDLQLMCEVKEIIDGLNDKKLILEELES